MCKTKIYPGWLFVELLSSNFFIKNIFIHLGFPFALNLNAQLTLNNDYSQKCAFYYDVHFAIPTFSLSTNGFLLIGTFNAWMQMRHSIVDSTNLEK